MSGDTALTMQALASIGGVIVGLAQCGLIWAGLRQMRMASAARDKQVDAQSDTLAALARGLETVIERTGGRGGTPA